MRAIPDRRCGWLALAMISACAAPNPSGVVRPQSRQQERSAPLARDAGPSRPARLQVVPDPAADLSPLLEAVADQLVGPGLTLPGPLCVQPALTERAPERLTERITALLQRRGRPTVSSVDDAAAAVLLLSSQQVDVVDGRRFRTLALLALVVAPRSGELLAVCGRREGMRLGLLGGGAAAVHPTASELLDLASDVGQVLRQKLTQPGLSLPPAGVVIEVQPVRNRTRQAIQADLAALWILKTMGRVPKVHAVLGARQRWGVTPAAATALSPTHLLKADLISSGGAGQVSRLAIHLRAQLVPLIATNAPLVEADATLLPPLVPDAQ